MYFKQAIIASDYGYQSRFLFKQNLYFSKKENDRFKIIRYELREKREKILHESEVHFPHYYLKEDEDIAIFSNNSNHLLFFDILNENLIKQIREENCKLYSIRGFNNLFIPSSRSNHQTARPGIYSLSTQNILWEKQIPVVLTVIDGYLIGEDAQLCLLKFESGVNLWTVDPSSLGEYEEWSDERSENVVMPGKVKRFLAVIDGVLIAVLSNESTLALDVNSGKILWHITDEIKIADKRSKRLFVISSKNYFEIDLKTGNKIDSFSFENGGSPFPVKSIADNFVFNGAHIFLYDSNMKNSTIGAFSISTKKFDWTHRLDGFIPVGKSLIAEDNYLCVVEQVKGQNNLLVFKKN